MKLEEIEDRVKNIYHPDFTTTKDIKFLLSELKRLQILWNRYKDADPKCRSIEYMVSVEQTNERLEAEVKRLREGIEKHRDYNLQFWVFDDLTFEDKTLYKLLED